MVLNKKEVYRYYRNAKDILKKSSIEDNAYTDVKFVREAFGTLWLAILKALDEAFLSKGVPRDRLPKDSRVYGNYIKKYLSQRDGKLQRKFWNLYDEVHVAGYYRSLLRHTDAVKGIFQAAEKFIDKVLK